MKYNAKEFISYIQAYECGCEGNTGFSDEKLDAYDRLRSWIEKNGFSFDSLSEFELKLSVVFDIPPRFIRKVYSNINIIGENHADFIFLLSNNYKLFIDMIKNGVFDEWIRNPKVIVIYSNVYGGLFDYIMSNVKISSKHDYKIEKLMLEIARAWIKREDELKMKSDQN